MLKGREIRVGAQPINWSNDDFHDLGGSTPLETCLGEMREAGYVGTELGHKFPKDAKALRPILDRFGLELASGWHSSYLATRELAEERREYLKHLDFLQAMGSKVCVIAECSARVYHDPKLALDWERRAEPFGGAEWRRVFDGLAEFARIAADRGMKLAYHPHMGTVVQTAAELDRLMNSTPGLWIVGDTGHLAFAGEDPLAVLTKYSSRIAHMHLKNVRPEIVARAGKERWTFEKSVREGVFTVPGDGGIDYQPIFALLKRIDYAGWMIVEAEQDPARANPLEYARKGRAAIRSLAGL